MVGRRSGSFFGSFLRYCFPKRIYAHPSAILDYKYFAVNAILQPLIAAPIMFSTAFTTDWTLQFLAAASGLAEIGLPTGAWATALMTISMLLAMDLGFFIAHYLQHKVPVLWEFHKVHHSAEVLTPITVYRMHPLDNVLTSTLAGLLSGVVFGLFSSPSSRSRAST